MARSRGWFWCRVLVGVSLVGGLVACTDVESRPEATQSGDKGHRITHYAVVVDRSTSVTTSQNEQYRQLTRNLIDEISFGDRLTIFVAYVNGRRDATKLVTRQMPTAMNRVRPLPAEQSALAAARASLSQAALPLFASPAAKGTDLFATLRTAGEHLAGSHEDGNRVLLMLSDMLHCVPGAICMERNTPDAVLRDWVSRSVEDGTLPVLKGVCVGVVGAEQATPHDARVREFWFDYFVKTGARIQPERYSYSAAGNPWRYC
jgi:hypothetical protein